MGYQKPGYQVVRERLLHWYLFIPRTFPITLEQLAVMWNDMEKPTRLGWGEGSKRQKIGQLQDSLMTILGTKEVSGAK